MQKKTSKLKKRFKNIKSANLWAISILFLVIIWIASGQFGDSKPLEAQKSSQNQPIIKVRAKKVQSKSEPGQIKVPTDIVSFKKVQIKPKISGSVKKLVAKDGSKVQKDQLILELDIDARAAQLSQAQAILKQRKTEYEAAKSLYKKKFTSKSKLQEAKANYEVAAANVKTMKLELSYTKIRAPFTGFVDKINVDVGDLVNAGQSVIANFIDDQKFRSISYISQLDIAKVKLGAKAKVKFAQEQEIGGEISFVSRVADENTKSFRVEAIIEDQQSLISDGQIGELIIQTAQQTLFEIPSSSLTLGSLGEIGVMLLDDSNLASFEAVDIIGEGENGLVIVGGIEQDQINLVTIGKDFITAGQKVDVNYD